MEQIVNKRKQKYNEATIYKDLTSLSSFISLAFINMRADFKAYTIEALKYIAEARALFRNSFTDENIQNKKDYLIKSNEKISCAELFLENLYNLKGFTQGQHTEITKTLGKIEFEIENFENYLTNKN